jgi:hypothetical protein
MQRAIKLQRSDIFHSQYLPMSLGPLWIYLILLPYHQ